MEWKLVQTLIVAEDKQIAKAHKAMVATANTAAVVNETRCKKRKESAMFESLEEKAYNVKFMNDPMVGGGNTSLEPLKELYPKFYCLKLCHP
jgi:hypothetical protein